MHHLLSGLGHHFVLPMRKVSLIIGALCGTALCPLPASAGALEGFLYNAGSFTTIEDPASPAYTAAFSINDSGTIVGQLPTVGFLYNASSFTEMNVPDAINSDARGINDRGDIVGGFADNGGYYGYLDQAGSFTTIAVPGAYTNTAASGINDRDEIVGSFTTPTNVTGPSKGFLDEGGSITTIAVPGAYNTAASGINDRGDIVGSFDSAYGPSYGFLDKDGSITTIAVPGAYYTIATGINDRGEIVGFFDDGDGQHGFLDDDGSFTTIDVPAALGNIGFNGSTEALGINDNGEIVGVFEAAVPEPSSLPLFAPALLGLFVLRRRGTVKRGAVV